MNSGPDNSDDRLPERTLAPAADAPDHGGMPPSQWRPHRLRPALLFLATCLTTFLVGIYWFSNEWFAPQTWGPGLVYMLAVMSILVAHEMGHFVVARWHRIPASLPYFIPFFPSFGTMGAVIGMQGSRANRKQLFDIGIAGPLAGLVLAIPITWKGIQQAENTGILADRSEATADADAPSEPGIARQFHDPLLIKYLVRYLRPDVGEFELKLNPLLLAGWVGFLITGLNMMPISQLDGGHISYALMGRHAHTLAKVLVVLAVAYMIWQRTFAWGVMLVLVLLIGIKHPPTADDEIPLGAFRQVLGWLSLLIPVLCFPPKGIT